MAYAADLKSAAVRIGGSTPLLSTIEWWAVTYPAKAVNSIVWSRRAVDAVLKLYGSVKTSSCAPVAQLAEHWTFNPGVVGSNPTGGTKDFDPGLC